MNLKIALSCVGLELSERQSGANTSPAGPPQDSPPAVYRMSDPGEKHDNPHNDVPNIPLLCTFTHLASTLHGFPRLCPPLPTEYIFAYLNTELSRKLRNTVVIVYQLDGSHRVVMRGQTV